MRGRAWTEDETRQLSNLVGQGFSNGEIAYEMSRPLSTIENKIRQLKLRGKSRAKVREFTSAADYRRSLMPVADVARMSDGRPVADMRRLMAGK